MILVATLKNKKGNNNNNKIAFIMLHAEVEGKINVMVSIIEEDGDSFAKRAEMFYKRRPHLLKILDDLHRSYRCLAENYDQISRSRSTRLNHPIPTSSSSKSSLTSQATRLQPGNIACISDCPDTAFEGAKDHISKYVMQQVLSTDQAPCKSTTYNCSYSKENLPKTPQTVFERERMEKRYSNNATSSSDTTINVGDHDDHLELVCLTREHKNIMWSSELIEDHLRQQSELVKRNEEKRMKIEELRSQMKKLMAENEALKSTNDLNAISPIPKLVNNKDANKPKGALFQLAKLTGCNR